MSKILVKITLKTFFSTLACSLIGFSLFAQQKPENSNIALPLDPNVRTGKLPNGLTYFIRHNESPKNRAVLNLVVKAGSILEDDDQRGLAHFIEHMSFNGTRNFPRNAIIDYLQKNGVRFGADINAYTGFDETVYQLPIPADKQILLNGIRILRDWAGEATLEVAAINKERGIILEEKRLQAGVDNRMQARYSPSLFNHSRYASRAPIGTEKVLKTFPKAALDRFYKDWYRPDLEAVVVVGDFDAAEMEKLIRRSFSGLKNPSPEKKRPEYKIGLSNRNQFMALTDPEMPSTVAQVIVKHRAEPLSTPNQYKKAIVTRLFNGILAKRFRQLSRNEKQDFLQADAHIGKLLADLDNFSFTVVSRPGKLQEAVSAAWGEVDEVKRNGFNENELSMEKQIYASGMENALKEKNNITSESYAREYAAYFLNNDLAPGIDTEYALVKRFLAEIKLEDLKDIASGYITNNNTDIIVLAPENALLPDEKKFRSWMASPLNGSSPLKVDAPAAAKDLLSSKPRGGKTISSTFDKTSSIYTLMLSNGIKVILKPTGFKSDEILFSGFSPGGTSLYAQKDYQSAKSAAAIVSSSGAGNFGAKDIDNFLANRQMGVQPFISELSQGVSGGSTKEHLEAALQLAFAYLTEPRADSIVFKNFIARSRQSLISREKNPQSALRDSINAILGGHHFRRASPSLAGLEMIDMKRCLEIFKERFANNSGMVFTFVGSFQADSIKPLLERYIGSLPSDGHPNHFRDNGIGIPKTAVQQMIRKGRAPRAKVELIFTGNLTYSPENSIKMDAIKEILQIRMIERLREEESGVYSPSVFLGLDKNPKPTFKLSIAFDCDPLQYRKLIASALDEVRKIKKEGPSVLNLQKYQAESIRSREIALHSNQWWLGYLSGQLEDAEPLNAYTQYLGRLDGLTSKSLKDMASASLSEENLIEVVLLPEVIE